MINLLRNDKLANTLKYCEEMVDRICYLVATNPTGLRKICDKYPDLPTRDTIYEWLYKYPEFREKYRAAKAIQVEPIVDDMFDIADDGSNDTVTRIGKDGEEYDACNTDWINRSRLRIDYRKWLVGKLAPRVYGEAVTEQKEASVIEQILDRIKSIKKDSK